MADLKLARLPDRTPVKMTIAMLPELHHKLGEYAALYAQAYGSPVAVADLVPAMLDAFLESDREFLRSRTRGR